MLVMMRAIWMNLMTISSNKTLVVVTGPTAVGKTGLAVRLAKLFHTEVISADARQLYRELPIGTAAPTVSQMREVKHHFIGTLSIKDPYNVSLFEEQALTVAEDIFARSDFVVLTGGSGLYIDTFCHGIDSLPRVDMEVRKHVRALYASEGLEGLRRLLRKVDPAYYNSVDLGNPNRIMRGIEVYLQTGSPLSGMHSRLARNRPFRIIKIVLCRERSELSERIRARTYQMIQEGLVEEALPCFRYMHLNALQTVGYKEIFDWLANRWSLQQAIEKIVIQTNRYARRQMTWYRRYENAHWFHPNNEDGIIQAIVEGDRDRR